MLSNKLPLEALQIELEPQAEQLAWVKANKAAILAQAESYEAQAGPSVTFDPSLWLGYTVPKIRIATVRRFLNTELSCLSYAIRAKESPKKIKNILFTLFAVIKQLV